MTEIPTERRLLAEQGLVMRTREQWGARFDYRDARTVTPVAEDFFLHVAVVDDPGDLLGAEDEVARRIERVGISRFPNTGMSYNALAFNTGRLYEGQPLGRRGAHTYNDRRLVECGVHGGRMKGPPAHEWNLNYNTRALCLPQQVDDPVTDAQIDAAAQWAAAQIRAGLARPDCRWHGHRCVAVKGCPGDRGFARIPELTRLTRHYVTVGLNPEEDDMDVRKFLDTPLNPNDPGGQAETQNVTIGEALVGLTIELSRNGHPDTKAWFERARNSKAKG